MASLLDQIKENIQSSNLNEDEKKEFADILVGVREEDLSPIAGLFSEDLSWVRVLYDNYKAKKAAFANNDSAAVERILKEEEEKLQQIEG